VDGEDIRSTGLVQASDRLYAEVLLWCASVFGDLKRLVALVVFGALLIVINSCVLKFVVQ
jgi:hypothetical protein